MIKASNLVKMYDNHLAVDHISFTIEKGHIVGFLGPNGAGKSTTMNMITGYIAATEGEITVAGHDIYAEPEEAKKHIGYLPEIPPLYPNMKVYEYLKFVAELKGVKKELRADAVEEVIFRMGLFDYSNRLIRQLSKGYKQRVGMAQALIGDPEVLIFDEPTVGLDPAQIIEIRALIKELAKEHTVILSSHIMQEISAVCDTVMIIDKGRLVANDTTKNLLQKAGKQAGLYLEVEGEKQAIDKALSEIKGIKQVNYKSSESDNAKGKEIYKFTIITDGTRDIRAKLFPALLAKECNILSLRNEEITLEQAFLELTGDSAEAKESAEETASSTDESVERADESAKSADKPVESTDESMDYTDGERKEK